MNDHCRELAEDIRTGSLGLNTEKLHPTELEDGFVIIVNEAMFEVEFVASNKLVTKRIS